VAFTNPRVLNNLLFFYQSQDISKSDLIRTVLDWLKDYKIWKTLGLVETGDLLVEVQGYLYSNNALLTLFLFFFQEAFRNLSQEAKTNFSAQLVELKVLIDE
jgi:hypothetical protein